MPPWQAVKGYGDFLNDLSLSQEEIALISSWAEGGAPEGEAIYLPETAGAEKVVLAPVPETLEELALEAETVLDRAVIAVGIRPMLGALEARAFLPDGSVRELIWLRRFEQRWARNYYFRSPVPLPAGTRVRVFSDAGGRAALLLGR
jgi:hypothetical protein